MNSDQFARWLKDQGIVITTKKGTGHKALFNPATGLITDLPTHGGSKQLPKGTVEGIKKKLGLK